MKYCCETFRRCYENSGRGITIRVSKPGTEFLASIQSRSVEIGQEKMVSSPVAVSILNQTRIECCPFCGAKLKSQYQKYQAELYKNEGLLYEVV